jgi:hypothetical protein
LATPDEEMADAPVQQRKKGRQKEKRRRFNKKYSERLKRA